MYPTLRPPNRRTYTKVVLDAYALNQHFPKIDPGQIQTVCRALGAEVRFAAIVNADNPGEVDRYTQHGFQTFVMNGDRPIALERFFDTLSAEMRADPPEQAVVITHEARVVSRMEQALQKLETRLQAWTFGEADQAQETTCQPRPLVNILPELRQARIYVFVDMENIWIGLRKRNWQGSVAALAAGIKTALAGQGVVTKMTFYADWRKLEQNEEQDLQRESIDLGYETVYLINRAGKNSVNLRIGDDLHAVVQRPEAAPDAADTIVIVSGDLDMRVAAERRVCGKKVIIIGLQGSLSRELHKAAASLHHLDEFLTAAEQAPAAPATRPDVRTLDIGWRVVFWAERNHWRFILPGRLQAQFGEAAAAQLEAAGWLEKRPRLDMDPTCQCPTPVLALNLKAPQVRAARFLYKWLPGRLQYYLKERKFPYLDTAFLARGMTAEPKLRAWGVGQTRAEVDALLEAAEAEGLIVKHCQPHPGNPKYTIRPRRLPED